MLNVYDAKTFSTKIGNIKRNTGRVQEVVGELWPHAMFYAAGLNGNANTDYLQKLIRTVVGTTVGGVALTTQIKIATKQVLPYVTFGKVEGAITVKAKGWNKLDEQTRRAAIETIADLFSYETPVSEEEAKPIDVKQAIDRLVTRLDKADKLSDRELFKRLCELIQIDMSQQNTDSAADMKKVA